MGCMRSSVTVIIVPCEHLHWIPCDPLHIAVTIASYERAFIQTELQHDQDWGRSNAKVSVQVQVCAEAVVWKLPHNILQAIFPRSRSSSVWISHRSFEVTNLTISSVFRSPDSVISISKLVSLGPIPTVLKMKFGTFSHTTIFVHGSKDNFGAHMMCNIMKFSSYMLQDKC